MALARILWNKSKEFLGERESLRVSTRKESNINPLIQRNVTIFGENSPLNPRRCFGLSGLVRGGVSQQVVSPGWTVFVWKISIFYTISIDVVS